MLKFKTCDPGMGSGHFLVNAANQISDLIVELLSEIPFVEGLKSKTTCAPNYWRRLVTRHCVYGVDLNPLAVHLAKLSLWLNCFAQNHRLTFLDHHLKCGNSLIGIRTLDQLEKLPERAKEKKRKNEQKLLFPMDLKKACQRAVGEIQKIEKMDEDATDKMKELLDDAKQESSNVVALADLYTAYLMDHSIEEESYRELFTDLARGQKPKSIFGEEILQGIQDRKSRHHFFHWVTEFPEIFSGSQPGFDAKTGNPPWDILKPNSREFFSTYDPNFRRYRKQEASKVIERLTDKHETIRAKWETYCKGFEEQSLYVRQPSAFRAVGNGDINTFKLFLERFFALLKNGGLMGIVTPSGLYTDQGCLPLREMFFDESIIKFLYCFENRWPTLFSAVDGRFKFILFCAEKGGKTESFKCAFMEHDPARLPLIEAGAVEMKIAHVKKFSPDSLSVMEFKSQRDVDVTASIYGDLPLLRDKNSDSWNIQLRRELDMTNASHLFKTKPTDWPLYEGKMIWYFDSDFDKPRYWVDKIEVQNYLGDAAWEAEHYRVGFRNVASSTNERTLVCGISPPSFHGNSFQTISPYSKDWNGPNEKETIWIASILSSQCIDFLIRQKVSTNLNFFFIESLPVPRQIVHNDIIEAIVAKAARLYCYDRKFGELWSRTYNRDWQSPAFWYPESAPIDAYGPAHEQAIRHQLRDVAIDLTPKWTPKCGVHDRLPDRRDTGDRAQLRAEIDAYVAHLYGLSRDDFAYILDTFPVLKKKEMQTFGEFRSKRKCLEEYDRVGMVLGRK